MGKCEQSSKDINSRRRYGWCSKRSEFGQRKFAFWKSTGYAVEHKVIPLTLKFSWKTEVLLEEAFSQLYNLYMIHLALLLHFYSMQNTSFKSFVKGTMDGMGLFWNCYWDPGKGGFWTSVNWPTRQQMHETKPIWPNAVNTISLIITLISLMPALQ